MVASINEWLTFDKGFMNTMPPHACPVARLFMLTLAGALLVGCGVSGGQAAPALSRGVTAQAERDTTSIRTIKREIKKHFERASLDRVFTVKTLGIMPAPAWNEFIFEGTLVEDDLTTGFFTFRIAGVYDAVAKEVVMQTQDLIGFQPPVPRAPRGSDGAQR